MTLQLRFPGELSMECYFPCQLTMNQMIKVKSCVKRSGFGRRASNNFPAGAENPFSTVRVISFYSRFALMDESISYLLWFCIFTLRDWLKKKHKNQW